MGVGEGGVLTNLCILTPAFDGLVPGWARGYWTREPVGMAKASLTSEGNLWDSTVTF